MEYNIMIGLNDNSKYNLVHCFFCNRTVDQTETIDKIRKTFRIDITGPSNIDNLEFRLICCECFEILCKELKVKICPKCRTFPIFDKKKKYCIYCINKEKAIQYNRELYGKYADLARKIRESEPEQFKITTPIVSVLLSKRYEYRFTNDKRRLQYKTRPDCCDTFITPLLYISISRKKHLYYTAICFNSKKLDKILNDTSKKPNEVIKELGSIIHIHEFIN